MKVALVIGSAGPGGGAERQIALLAEGLHRIAGIPVVLCSMRDKDQYWGEWVQGRGVPFFAIPPGPRPLRLLRIFQVLDRFKPDVVHGWLTSGGLYGCVAGRLAGAKVLVYGERGPTTDLKRRPTLVAVWLLGHWVDGIVCNSSLAARDLPRRLHLEPSRFHYIPNGFVPPEEPAADRLAEVRAELDPDGTGRVVLMVGNVTPLKGYDLFLDVARAVIARDSRARFVAAGGGSDLERFQRLARSVSPDGRIRFLGPRSDVPALMRCASVFLHTGPIEGMSNAAMEAMYSGLPVVAVASGGHLELVEDGVDGLLFPVGHPEQGARLVLELLDDPERSRRLGEAARLKMGREFSVDTMVRRHVELYHRLLGRRE